MELLYQADLRVLHIINNRNALVGGGASMLEHVSGAYDMWAAGVVLESGD